MHNPLLPSAPLGTFDSLKCWRIELNQSTGCSLQRGQRLGLNFSKARPGMKDLAATHLFQHAVESFRAADVETDEDGV